MCEMLVDPSGNRQVTGDSPKPGQGRVGFVVEVCDPSEAADFGYTVNGIVVSDFYTPHFFDPVAAGGVRYCFTGALKAPRQILRGGYLSWTEPQSDHLWQQIWFEGGTPTFRDLGPTSKASGSLRAYIDRMTEPERAAAMAGGRMRCQFAGLDLTLGKQSSSANAARWRKQIASILGRSQKGRSKATARSKSARRK
jgi:hypothetical protein